jgi:hypothetical protein
MIGRQQCYLMMRSRALSRIPRDRSRRDAVLGTQSRQICRKRSGQISIDPRETMAHAGRCPACGEPVTVGAAAPRRQEHGDTDRTGCRYCCPLHPRKAAGYAGITLTSPGFIPSAINS